MSQIENVHNIQMPTYSYSLPRKDHQYCRWEFREGNHVFNPYEQMIDHYERKTIPSEVRLNMFR